MFQDLVLEASERPSRNFDDESFQNGLPNEDGTMKQAIPNFIYQWNSDAEKVTDDTSSLFFAEVGHGAGQILLDCAFLSEKKCVGHLLRQPAVAEEAPSTVGSLWLVEGGLDTDQGTEKLYVFTMCRKIADFESRSLIECLLSCPWKKLFIFTEKVCSSGELLRIAENRDYASLPTKGYVQCLRVPSASSPSSPAFAHCATLAPPTLITGLAAAAVEQRHSERLHCELYCLMAPTILAFDGIESLASVLEVVTNRGSSLGSGFKAHVEKKLSSSQRATNLLYI